MAATAALFSVPAALEVLARQQGRSGLDGLDWSIAGGACAAGLALTLAARGLAETREFLSAGLVASCAWLAGSRILSAGGEFVATYVALTVGILVAELHLLPVALYVQWRSARGRLGEDRLRRVSSRLLGAALAPAVLDLSPAALVFAPSGARAPAAFVVLATCAVSGGVFAALAASELSNPSASPGAGNCEETR